MKKTIVTVLITALIVIPSTTYASYIWRDQTMNADASNNGTVRRYDDNRYQVKCWQYTDYNKGGLSCIPWSEIKER